MYIETCLFDLKNRRIRRINKPYDASFRDFVTFQLKVYSLKRVRKLKCYRKAT